jgi:hypothetical protein
VYYRLKQREWRAAHARATPSARPKTAKTKTSSPNGAA